jgi:hypothetical protein
LIEQAYFGRKHAPQTTSDEEAGDAAGKSGGPEAVFGLRKGKTASTARSQRICSQKGESYGHTAIKQTNGEICYLFRAMWVDCGMQEAEEAMTKLLSPHGIK